MKHDTEIREILALQAKIKELKKEVSTRLGKIRDEEDEKGYALKFVIDGEVWGLTRWSEVSQRIDVSAMKAWCLQKEGRSL